MEVFTLLFLFLTSTSLATSHASHVGRRGLPLPIQPLRPNTIISSTSTGHHLHVVSCQSWRLGVETNNIRDWTLTPECLEYVLDYLFGDLYSEDSKMVTIEAASYAAGLNLTGDGKDVWVFDIDETVLSCLPYVAEHASSGINMTLLNEWLAEGVAPALPNSLELYQKILSLGIKVVFLTGRSEAIREATEKNLKNEGYDTWERLILRPNDAAETALVYKSGEREMLEGEGYRIVGNMGDQWSDILGTSMGQRTFKAPNPMYYLP